MSEGEIDPATAEPPLMRVKRLVRPRRSPPGRPPRGSSAAAPARRIRNGLDFVFMPYSNWSTWLDCGAHWDADRSRALMLAARHSSSSLLSKSSTWPRSPCLRGTDWSWLRRPRGLAQVRIGNGQGRSRSPRTPRRGSRTCRLGERECRGGCGRRQSASRGQRGNINRGDDGPVPADRAALKRTFRVARPSGRAGTSVGSEKVPRSTPNDALEPTVRLSPATEQ